jgi:hypothetical protein
MEKKNPRFAEIAWIADVGQFRLRTWIERDQITLDASTTRGIHRRFSFFDGLKIAIVGRLTSYGMEVKIADGMTAALFNSTPIGGYLIEFRRGGMSKEPDPEKFLDALKHEVWVLTRQYDERGESWQRMRFPEAFTQKLITEENLRNRETIFGGSAVVIDIHAIAKEVTKRWETITSQSEI